MAMVNRQISTPVVLFGPVLGAVSGRVYAQLVERYGSRYMRFCTIGFVMIWMGMWVVAGSIAAICFAERPLLQGAHVIGEVLQLDVKPYRPNGSRTEYETAVTYSFATPDGRRFIGATRRTLASPPALLRGGPIDVLYEPGNPGHSTMRKEFASDMANKQFGAGLFLLLGIYPALFVYRYMRWRREAGADLVAPRP
jgi:hypothetical protein